MEEIFSSDHLDLSGEVSISSYIRHLESLMERFGDLPIVMSESVPHVPTGTSYMKVNYLNDGTYAYNDDADGSPAFVLDVV